MTFAYAAIGGRAIHPAIPFLLQGPSGGTEFPLFGLPDSGADGSCFPEEWAEPLGIDLGRCQAKPVRTGAGLGCHYDWREPLSMTVGDVKIPVRATFGPVNVAILGRADFFEHFYVEIDEKRKLTHITPHGTFDGRR